MTQSSLWRLDEHRAQLNLGQFAAVVDIAQPGRGLHDVALRGAAMTPWNLLAVQFTGQDSQQTQTVSDCFVRGRDLVVTYAQAFELPVRLQIYWRALGEADAPGCLAAFEVQVSVQTSLLDAWPEVVIRSRLQAPCAVRHDSQADGTPASSWLCRLPTVGLTYGEMAHPADVAREELVTADTGTTEIAHHLFSQPLEKGVILRARARGVFVSLDDDVRAIEAACDRFLAAPLPLTT